MPGTGKGQVKGLYRQSMPVYEIRDFQNHQNVQMAQDHLGLWWFRHTYVHRVMIAGTMRDVLAWGTWQLPEPQPDPRYLPGPQARRLHKKTAYLPCGADLPPRPKQPIGRPRKDR